MALTATPTVIMFCPQETLWSTSAVRSVALPMIVGGVAAKLLRLEAGALTSSIYQTYNSARSGPINIWARWDSAISKRDTGHFGRYTGLVNLPSTSFHQAYHAHLLPIVTASLTRNFRRHGAHQHPPTGLRTYAPSLLQG